MGIAAVPLGMKDLMLIFTTTGFTAFWVLYMASESAQRSGGSSLFTQTWERSTDTWAPCQLHNISVTLDKLIQEGRKKAHLKHIGAGSSDSKDIQPSPQPAENYLIFHPSPELLVLISSTPSTVKGAPGRQIWSNSLEISSYCPGITPSFPWRSSAAMKDVQLFHFILNLYFKA